MYFHYIAMGYMFFSQVSTDMSILYVYISIPLIMDSIQFQSMQKKNTFKQFFNSISQLYFMKLLIFYSKSYFTQVKRF